MTKEEKREWKAEKKIRKAIKRYVKLRKNLLSLQTDIHANKERYLIIIKKAGGVE